MHKLVIFTLFFFGVSSFAAGTCPSPDDVRKALISSLTSNEYTVLWKKAFSQAAIKTIAGENSRYTGFYNGNNVANVVTIPTLELQENAMSLSTICKYVEKGKPTSLVFQMQIMNK